MVSTSTRPGWAGITPPLFRPALFTPPQACLFPKIEDIAMGHDINAPFNLLKANLAETRHAGR